MSSSNIESLAINGMDELCLSAADTESRGTDSGIVEAACTELTNQASSIVTFVGELEATKTQLLANWEGVSADGFEAKFPELISAFEQIPTCINSIADWADELSKKYIEIDNASFSN